ncbi:MAG TPA: hypothetical protein VJ810_07345 [Blastocatellia bacterium]|nr:hypothetical protein [Blastocatellia bacterium]
MSSKGWSGEELSVPADALRWPEPAALGSDPERILALESAGGRPLTLVSNYPYELWLDGRFVGDGGHRCAPGEALADQWEEAAEARAARVRLHWLDPRQTTVLYRCLFDDPFFAELAPGPTWTCSIDPTVRFAAKASTQLPRQNIIIANPAEGPRLELQSVSSTTRWRILSPPIGKARYIPIDPRLVGSVRLPAQLEGPFHPEEAENVALYIRDQRPCNLQCDTFDLGQIALHRFELDSGSSSCVLYYSEVADFETATFPRHRAKVQLADAIQAEIQGAAPFGVRGCRYVHVLYPATSATKPVIRAWRREYPIRWRPVEVEPEDEAIIRACRANLVACVDGGAIDTCWRERAQWTGDLRMSAAALRALTENLEVVDLALHQIAQSYNPRTGMINGAWPVLKPGTQFPIPPFHLAFCLTALEHDPSLERDLLVRQVVQDSLAVWTRLYLRDGLIQGMSGWYFTDWDPTDPAATGREKDYPGPHAVCNAWWNEWCGRMDPAQAGASDAFDAAFWMGRAYALNADKSRESPHATAAALNSSAGRNHIQESLRYLEEEVAAGRLAERVTPYFAYFVARAFSLVSHERAVEFIRGFYGPIAREYGSIYEKTFGYASLAHGWSVGIVSLLVRSRAEL